MHQPYFTTVKAPNDVSSVSQDLTVSPHAFLPHPNARAPWADDMLHGRLLGGLAARSLEQAFGGDGWRCARLTVDLFRPAGMAPVSIATTEVRMGRRVRVGDAAIVCDGHSVGRVTGLFLAESEEPPGRVWTPPDPEFPPPDTVTADAATGAAENEAWMFRVVRGGMGTGQQSAIWTNETAPLVDDEPLTPLVRSAVSGDIACPLANSSDAGLFYINADYTMLLGRYPVGDWIGLDVDQQLSADGISIASATLVDEQGPFATSGGTSLARPPLAS